MSLSKDQSANASILEAPGKVPVRNIYALFVRKYPISAEAYPLFLKLGTDLNCNVQLRELRRFSSCR